jgi:CheY-like chemotaxis protein
VHVELDFADELWPVEVDPGELELVILNLAVNARDAMPAGGTITIRAENVACGENIPVKGDSVTLSLIDTGSGMSQKVLDRVFEPFFTTKEVGKGSGLGLPQVYGFAKQSGGSISIESEIGKGTCVTLHLPRSAKMPVAEPEQILNLRAGHTRANFKGRILLVEDDDEVAELVTEMLDQLGYDVLRVASAKAALGALANDRGVDIVFSDIMMPGGMNGLDLVREIRARRRQLPVLLTSGYSEATKGYTEAEGIRILPKPYCLDDLATALRATMSDQSHGGFQMGVPPR